MHFGNFVLNPDAVAPEAIPTAQLQELKERQALENGEQKKTEEDPKNKDGQQLSKNSLEQTPPELAKIKGEQTEQDVKIGAKTGQQNAATTRDKLPQQNERFSQEHFIGETPKLRLPKDRSKLSPTEDSAQLAGNPQEMAEVRAARAGRAADGTRVGQDKNFKNTRSTTEDNLPTGTKIQVIDTRLAGKHNEAVNGAKELALGRVALQSAKSNLGTADAVEKLKEASLSHKSARPGVPDAEQPATATLKINNERSGEKNNRHHLQLQSGHKMATEAREISILLAKDIAEPRENIAKGRLDALRHSPNEGMQYVVATGKQNSQLANQSDKQQSGFDFSHNSSDAGAGTTLADIGAGSPSNFFHSSNGSNGVNGSNAMLRGFAQQMAQRLQEGPLAQLTHNLRQIQFRLQDNNRGEIRLRLHPEQLGEVRIYLHLDGSQLGGRIVASSAETARILQGNMQNLQDSLRDGGFESQGLNVSVGGGQTGTAASQNFAGNNRLAGRLSADNDWEDIVPDNTLLLQEQRQIDYSA